MRYSKSIKRLLSRIRFAYRRAKMYSHEQPKIILPQEKGVRLGERQLVELSLKILEYQIRWLPEAWGSEHICYLQAKLANYCPYVDNRIAALWWAHCYGAKRVLEVGVRSGLLLSHAVIPAPECEVWGYDLFPPTYGGMESPTQAEIEYVLRKFGHRGMCNWVTGNSHQTLKQLPPNLTFDIVSVDADHTDTGAWQDLIDVENHVGGLLVFDDILHPGEPHLIHTWRRFLARHPGWYHLEYLADGFGVGLASPSQPIEPVFKELSELSIGLYRPYAKTVWQYGFPEFYRIPCSNSSS